MGNTELISHNRVSYIGGSWRRDVAFAGYDVPMAADIRAGEMIERVQGVSAARRKLVMDVLDVQEAHTELHTATLALGHAVKPPSGVHIENVHDKLPARRAHALYAFNHFAGTDICRHWHVIAREGDVPAPGAPDIGHTIMTYQLRVAH